MAVSDLGLDILDDLSPNGIGKPGRFQHAHDNSCRQARLFVIYAQDGPGGATRQPEGVCLLVKRVKSCRHKRLANAPDLDQVFWLHSFLLSDLMHRSKPSS